MSKAGDKLIAAAREALEVARGNLEPARLTVPPDVDVRAIRRKTGLSQGDFANDFAFTLNQIRDWEQGRSRPLGATRAYLLLIERDPDGILGMLRAAYMDADDRAA